MFNRYANPVNKIQSMLNRIDDSTNRTANIYLNAIKNEFIKLSGEIEVPRLSVKELDYTTAIKIFESIHEYIPEFLYGHRLLENRKPESDQHALHFVMPVRGKVLEYVHILKIYFKFGGDSVTITRKGDSDNYPAYKTDRLYYKSRIIPVKNYHDTDTIDFEPVRFMILDYVESDQRLFTTSLFDEADTAETTKNIYKKINLDIFNISPEFYPFFVYDYLTSCFNILYPTNKEILEAINITEPVFLLIFAKYNILNKYADIEKAKNIYADIIDFENVSLKDNYLPALQNYFKRFSVFRDDELSLKGWWKIDIKS